MEANANTLLSCSLPKAHARKELRELAFSLCAEMQAHVAFENRVLVPVIERVDAWDQVRAEQLVADHAQQLELLRAYADVLSEEECNSQTLATAVRQLVQNVRLAMRDEEAQLLSPALLLDQGGEGVETG